MEKYLVASSGDTLDSKVSGRFGHSGYFLVINPQTMEFEAFPGVSNGDYPSIRKFISADIKKVIVGNIGPSTYDVLVSSGFTVYLCRNMPVFEAVKKVAAGDIPLLKEPTLKDSIHSARKAGGGYGGRREDRGTGRGLGLGPGDGSGMGGGQGRGMGGGRGKRGRG